MHMHFCCWCEKWCDWSMVEYFTVALNNHLEKIGKKTQNTVWTKNTQTISQLALPCRHHHHYYPPSITTAPNWTKRKSLLILLWNRRRDVCEHLSPLCWWCSLSRAVPSVWWSHDRGTTQHRLRAIVVQVVLVCSMIVLGVLTHHLIHVTSAAFVPVVRIT